MNTHDNNGTSPTESVVFHPIGHVENSFYTRDESGSGDGVPSRIILQDAFEDGLKGLEPGHEILVVFWFHRSMGYELLQHPRGDTSRAKRGVFTLRSPHRPNPIGITQVRITGLEGSVMSVTGLDAFNGTPVPDIKPVDQATQ